MPTKNYTETVTRCVDVCDFCSNECGSLGHNRCDICGRIACYNCGLSDNEGLLSGIINERVWLCRKCNELGIVHKQTIRRLKEQITTERSAWRKLGKERAVTH